MMVLIVIAVALAAIPGLNTFFALFLLRTPPMPAKPPRVAILIPARDEEAVIGACLDAALASTGADIEVIMLDDGSSDATMAIARARAARDPRLRVATAPPPPAGWGGKPNACQVLASLTDRPYLLFVDADVRLAPEAAARLVPPTGIDLVSGVPRQRVVGLVEMAVVPMINSLIFGYLPIWFMRQMPKVPALAAACGQMMMVRASAYHACGGHSSLANSRHDGLQLPRHFRRQGHATDLVDGTWLATCRMYEGASAVWRGFSKNATEGMARPLALPVWTMLLAGGHLLPAALLAAMIIDPAACPFSPAVFAAVAVLLVARTAQMRKCREPALAVALHPLGVFLTLCIQWTALWSAFRGTSIEWRGRIYSQRAP